MLFAPLKGRPFGERAFIVKKTLIIENVGFLNKHLSYLTLNVNNQLITFISVYFAFDNNSQLNLSEFQACLHVIQELFLFYSVRRHIELIMGDFKADISRSNRFNIIFKNFLPNNNFNLISPKS